MAYQFLTQQMQAELSAMHERRHVPARDQSGHECQRHDTAQEQQFAGWDIMHHPFRCRVGAGEDDGDQQGQQDAAQIIGAVRPGGRIGDRSRESKRHGFRLQWGDECCPQPATPDQ